MGRPLGRLACGGGVARADGLTSAAVDSNNLISPDRDVLSEARALRVQVLNMSLLFAVVVGGLGFARTLIDAMDLEEWRIVGGAVLASGRSRRAPKNGDGRSG